MFINRYTKVYNTNHVCIHKIEQNEAKEAEAADALHGLNKYHLTFSFHFVSALQYTRQYRKRDKSKM